MSETAPRTEPIVLVEDVHTYYGKSHILHGVTLHVQPGEVVGLLGRNGVGKSTTLKTIMGLVQPSHGSVLLDGNAITTLFPRTSFSLPWPRHRLCAKTTGASSACSR